MEEDDDVLHRLSSFVDETRAILCSVSERLRFPLQFSEHQPALATCTADKSHRVPFSSLFQHTIKCQKKLSRSRARQTQSIDSIDQPISSSFFYSDAPAVIPLGDKSFSPALHLDFPPPPEIFVYVTEATSENSVAKSCYYSLSQGRDDSTKGDNAFCMTVDNFNPKKISACTLWHVEREVDDWNSFPSTYSFHVKNVVACFPGIRPKFFGDWLLECSCNHGFIMKPQEALQLSALFRLVAISAAHEAVSPCTNDEVFIQSKEAAHCPEDPYRRRRHNSSRFECHIFSIGLFWLKDQFQFLFGSEVSYHFVLKLFKKILIHAAYSLAGLDNISMRSDPNESDPLELSSSHVSAVDSLFSSSKSDDGLKDKNESNALDSPSNAWSLDSDEIAQAQSSLQDCIFRHGCLKMEGSFSMVPSSSSEKNIEYELLSNAAAEIRKRKKYRSIVQDDELFSTGQRDVGGAGKSSELGCLASERDYKRRRIKYKTKPTGCSAKEIMRNMINSYMNEIMETGGICEKSSEIEKENNLNDR